MRAVSGGLIKLCTFLSLLQLPNPMCTPQIELIHYCPSREIVGALVAIIFVAMDVNARCPVPRSLCALRFRMTSFDLDLYLITDR